MDEKSHGPLEPRSAFFEAPYHSGMPDEKILDAVRAIYDKVPEYDHTHLDKSILEAHLDEVLFLGKLEGLDKIVEGGRESTKKLVDALLKKILSKGTGGSEEFHKELRSLIDSLETDEEINAHINYFTGQRFNEEMGRQWNDKLDIWTHGYFMTVMTRAVSDKFAKNENVDERQLKSVGTLFFDLDGLKFLNEVSGYNAGDKALWVMARALMDPELVKWAEKSGIELVPSHHHGDEFLMGIIAEDGIDLTDNKNAFIGVNGENVQNISLIKYIGDYVTKKVNNFGQRVEGEERRKEFVNNLVISEGVGRIQKYNKNKRRNKINEPKNIKDVIDFSDKKQRDRLSEFKAQLPSELAELLDENFKYQLSCSYGYSTLEDAVAKNIRDGIRFDDPEVYYEYLIYKLTGKGLMDSAETKLKIAKEVGKEVRRNSNDLRLQLLEKFYRFGRESDIENSNLREIYEKTAHALIELELELKKLLKKTKEEKRSVGLKYGRLKKTMGWRGYHEGRERRDLERKIAELEQQNSELRKSLESLGK